MPFFNPTAETVDVSGKRYSFNTVDMGRRNEDGDVWPHNEPLLVKKETIIVSQTSGTAAAVISDIFVWLGIESADYQEYFIRLFVLPDRSSDFAVHDDIEIGLADNVGGIDYMIRNDNIEYWGNEADQGVPMHIPSEANKILNLDHTLWGAGETHRSAVTVEGYRYPKAIL